MIDLSAIRSRQGNVRLRFHVKVRDENLRLDSAWTSASLLRHGLKHLGQPS